MKRFIFVLFILLLFSQYPFQAQGNTVMIITGSIKHTLTNNPISEATISIPKLDLSPVKSDQKGNFKFIVMVSKPIEIKVIKEGYKPYEKLLIPQEKVDLHIKLVPQSEKLEIIMTNFRKNSYITGQVSGLSENEYKDYKILVYVLTDKWYIHPWAENKEGRGYANIADDGTWRIKTVFRGYQAYRVAFLLTKQSTYAPSTVRIFSDNPDQDLLSKVDFKKELIIEAPEGI